MIELHQPFTQSSVAAAFELDLPTPMRGKPKPVAA
jgi:hypothetical protein